MLQQKKTKISTSIKAKLAKQKEIYTFNFNIKETKKLKTCYIIDNDILAFFKLIYRDTSFIDPCLYRLSNQCFKNLIIATPQWRWDKKTKDM